MFIAIIGTRLSGKTTVETYLTDKGFVPVKIIPQTSGLRDRVQRRSVVPVSLGWRRACSLFRLSCSLSSSHFQGITVISFLL
jgi:hypothetical protein